MLSHHVRAILKDSRSRYVVVGGTCFVLEYGTFTGLSLLAIPLVFANIVSFLVGLSVSFALHNMWTFKSDGYQHSSQKQFMAYALLATINVFLSSALIVYLVDFVGVPKFIAKVLCMIAIVLWNYTLLNRIIFRKSPNS